MIRSGAGAPPRPKLSPAASKTVERGAVPGIGEEQVQEARARHLEALQLLAQTLCQRIAQPLGQLARLGARGWREQQCGVRGVVAEVLARRALERDRSLQGGAAGVLAGEGQHGLAQTCLGGRCTHGR